MKSKKFDQEFVNQLIKNKESQTLDFKQKINSKEKIAKTLCAMANTEGGIFLIGLSDQRQIIGIDPEEERYMVEAANEEYCVPKVSLTSTEIKVSNRNFPESENEQEKTLLMVTVAKSEGRIVRCKDQRGEFKSYIRVEDRTLAV